MILIQMEIIKKTPTLLFPKVKRIAGLRISVFNDETLVGSAGIYASEFEPVSYQSLCVVLTRVNDSIKLSDLKWSGEVRSIRAPVRFLNETEINEIIADDPVLYFYGNPPKGYMFAPDPVRASGLPDNYYSGYPERAVIPIPTETREQERERLAKIAKWKADYKN